MHVSSREYDVRNSTRYIHVTPDTIAGQVQIAKASYGFSGVFDLRALSILILNNRLSACVFTDIRPRASDSHKYRLFNP